MHVARSMHPLSDKRTKLPLSLSSSLPPASYLERTEFPHCHPRSGPLSLLTLCPLPPARCPLYHPRVSFCRQMRAIRPMLNATFDSLHLRGAPHALSSLLFRLVPRRPSATVLSTSLSLSSLLCTVYASSTSTRVYRARTVFIDSCQS